MHPNVEIELLAAHMPEVINKIIPPDRVGEVCQWLDDLNVEYSFYLNMRRLTKGEFSKYRTLNKYRIIQPLFLTIANGVAHIHDVTADRFFNDAAEKIKHADLFSSSITTLEDLTAELVGQALAGPQLIDLPDD